MDTDDGDVSQVFHQLGEIEKQIETAELEARRHKEFLLQPLYEQRQEQVNLLPSFWPQVLGSAPEDVRAHIADADLEILAHIKSLRIERYAIKSATEGDPRNLRFTFEFEPNKFLQETKLVKEFQYRSLGDGSGGLVSAPVPIKWKSKKQDVTGGLLDAAGQLYQAEEAIRYEKGEMKIDVVQREALYQYETLRQKIAETESPSFFNWFGYRGAVADAARVARSQNGEDDGDVDVNEDEDDLLLDVEVFPDGEEFTVALADDLWPNLMEYFMAAQADPDEDVAEYEVEEVNSESDEKVPQLVDHGIDVTEVLDTSGEASTRPRKRQRRG